MNKFFFFKNLEKICRKKYPLFQSYILKKNHEHYQVVLEEFVKILNDNLNLTLKKNSWNLIIGPWLKNSIDIFEHKKIIIKDKNFFRNYYKEKKFNKILIPNDYTEYMDSLNNDQVNQSLFLYLIHKNSNFKFENKKLNLNSLILFLKSIRSIIKILFVRFSNMFSSNKTIIIDNPFTSSTVDKKNIDILKKKNKNVIFYPYSNLRNFVNFFVFGLNFKKRETIIRNLNSNQSKIKNTNLLIYLFATIPINYFERFYLIKFFSKILFFGRSFYSRVAQLDNEFFKFYRANNKSKLFLDQHGGNYSFINEKYYLYFEKFYGNKIFFWDRLNNKKFSSKFNSLKIISEGMKKYDLSVENEICYIMSFNKKYDYQNIFHEHFDYNYSINSLLNFCNNTNKFVKIKIAPQRHEHQIDEEDLLKIKIKKNQIIQNREEIFKSKILVFDGLGSGVFETRIYDLPFIAIVKKKNYFLSKVGIEMIDKLKNANLIFEDSKKAAKYINQITNIDRWWKQRKNVINKIFYNKEVKFKI